MNKVNNSRQIYNAIIDNKFAKYDHSWAEYHAFTEKEDLEKQIDVETLPKILGAKKSKLYGKIYEVIEACIQLFQAEIDESHRKIELQYTILDSTMESMAQEICRYIHPIALDFPHPTELEWCAIIQKSISKSERPISLDDTRFINPSKHTELEDFHDLRNPQDNMNELISQEIYEEVFLNIFPNQLLKYIRDSEQIAIYWEL